jgi:hypothetical protein
VFGNRHDDLDGLERVLARCFAEHEIRVVGSIAVFVAHV